MNKRIFAELLTHSQNNLDKISQPYIKEKFGVEPSKVIDCSLPVPAYVLV